MSITDELRKYVADNRAIYITPFAAKCLIGIADSIDAEHEAMLADARKAVYQDYVALPKDADGEYVCAGDKLDGYGKTIDVVELRYGRSGWVLISRDGNAYADTFAFTHHHAPTVEDVLREMADRCYADEDEPRDRDAIVAEYAAKLRLAGEDE